MNNTTTARARTTTPIPTPKPRPAPKLSPFRGDNPASPGCGIPAYDWPGGGGWPARKRAAARKAVRINLTLDAHLTAFARDSDTSESEVIQKAIEVYIR